MAWEKPWALSAPGADAPINILADDNIIQLVLCKKYK